MADIIKEKTNESIRLEIKVIPNARKNEFVKTETGYRARLAAPPADGKANDALILLLSNEFGIPKKDIEIIRGQTSRNKTVLIKQ